MDQMPPKGPPQAPPSEGNSPEALVEQIASGLAQLQEMAAEAGVDAGEIQAVSEMFGQVIAKLQGGGAPPSGPTQGGPGSVPAL